MDAESFTRKYVPSLGRSVHRVGLACNMGLDAAGFERALERGVQYVFWTTLRTGKVKSSLVAALRRRREDVVLACGPNLAYFGGSVRRAAERRLRDLGVDQLDVLTLFWLGKTSAWTPGTVEALVKLKEEGKVKAIGVSIHDRPRAAELVKDSPLDLFMLRYNAAHPGAEREVFPHLALRKPAVLAYTATSWRRLLKAPAGYAGPIMSAGDCYRFCLSSPHVDLALMGAADAKQVDANLDAVERGPLSPEEEKWMRAFGARVHG